MTLNNEYYNKTSEVGHHPYKRQMRRLLPRHMRALDYYVAGHDIKTISKMLEADGVPLSTQALGMIVKSPLFQAEAARMRKEMRLPEVIRMDREAAIGKARSILEQASVKAAEKIEELVDSGNEGISLKAASQILDRVFGPNDHKSAPAVVNVTAEQISLLTLALKETGHVQLDKQLNGRKEESPANSQAAGSTQDSGHGAVQEDAHEPTLWDGLPDREAQDQGLDESVREDAA